MVLMVDLMVMVGFVLVAGHRWPVGIVVVVIVMIAAVLNIITTIVNI